MKKSSRSSSKTFSQVILQLFALIFFIAGILLLTFTKEIQEVALTDSTSIAGKLSLVIQQFLGNTYMLLGILLYLMKDTKGKRLYITLSSLFIIGFINLYLIFIFDYLIFVPSIYFIFQSLLQLLIFLALIDEARKK